MRRLWFLISALHVLGHREDVSKISHESLYRLVLPSNASTQSHRSRLSRGRSHKSLISPEGVPCESAESSVLSHASLPLDSPKLFLLSEKFRPSFATTALMCTVFGVACLGLLAVNVCSSHTSEIQETFVDARVELRAQLESLNGLRTISVVYAVLYYLNTVDGFKIPHACSLWPMRYLTVLSGFILYYTSEKRVASFTWRSGLIFSLRRISRLSPVFCVALVLDVIVEAKFPRSVPGLPDFTLDQIRDMLLMTLSFPFFYNLRRRFNLGVTVVVLFFILVSLPLLSAVTLDNTHMTSSLRIMEFFAGFLSAHLCSVVPSWELIDGYWWLIFDGSLIWAFFLGATTNTASPEIQIEEYLLTGIFCVACVAARGMMESGGSGNHFGYLSFGLTLWPLAPLSENVFALYLMKDFSLAVWNASFPAAPKAAWPILVLFVWINAWVVHHLVEKPLRRVLDTRFFCSYQPKASGR